MGKDYNPNAWFQWRELATCAVQVVVLLAVIFGVIGVALYLLLVR